MRAISLVKSYPVIASLSLLCSWLLWASWQTEKELSSALLRIETLEDVEPLVQECNDTVKVIQKDCRAEVKKALDGVKPVVIEIEKPAKGAGDFNQWIKERIE